MPTHENQLLAALPRTDRARLLLCCEPVHLVLSQTLGTVDALTRHAYFPTDSFVSLIAQGDAQHSLEVGMAGSEGMCGVHLALGARRDALRVVVQGGGQAWRIDSADLRRELDHSPALRSRLLRYAAVLLRQHAVAAVCLRFHEIGPRLARWLLMTQDRAHADRFSVTHEFLAAMLGVRRVGVTVAAGALQRQGLIAYHRGGLVVLDRPGLELASCACYFADQRLYDAGLQGSR